MAEVLDFLPGRCPVCGGGPVLIDGEGLGRPNYWVYCDKCNHTCCSAATPDEVAAEWERTRGVSEVLSKDAEVRRIDRLRFVYNNAYAQQRRIGISGGDAERVAMRTLLAHLWREQ